MASRSFRRRTRLDIIASILDDCRQRNNKTHVMYHCNLSFKQFAGYLELLLKADLVLMENDRRNLMLKASGKGKRFLKAYDGMKKALME